MQRLRRISLVKEGFPVTVVAYNFKKQFIKPIQYGTKTQTIRAIGKRAHATVGSLLQLYYGQRTTQCEKIIDDVYCRRRETVQIAFERGEIIDALVGGKSVADLDQFAIADGFNCISAMTEFWNDSYPQTAGFTGRLLPQVLIGWDVPFQTAPTFMEHLHGEDQREIDDMAKETKATKAVRKKAAKKPLVPKKPGGTTAKKSTKASKGTAAAKKPAKKTKAKKEEAVRIGRESNQGSLFEKHGAEMKQVADLARKANDAILQSKKWKDKNEEHIQSIVACLKKLGIKNSGKFEIEGIEIDAKVTSDVVVKVKVKKVKPPKKSTKDN